MPGEAKHYETRKSGVVLSKPHSPFLYFPKYLFLSRNFWKIKNGRLPLAAFSLPSGLKIFQNFKNRILPPWVMSSLPSCRNLLAYHSYSEIFPGNETGDIPPRVPAYMKRMPYICGSHIFLYLVVILVLLFSISVS